MQESYDAQREAHLLGEELRYYRARTARTRGADPAPLHAMEARLAALWTAVRAARAAGPGDDANRTVRRARPKWG